MTANGARAYVFQSEFRAHAAHHHRRSDAWSIAKAHAKARELQRNDDGRDPREVKAEATAADAAEASQESAEA